MPTLIIGLREFRAHLTEYTNRVAQGETKLIILNKNKPVLEVKGIPQKDFVLEEYIDQTEKARGQGDAGLVYSSAEIRHDLGLAEKSPHPRLQSSRKGSVGRSATKRRKKDS